MSDNALAGSTRFIFGSSAVYLAVLVGERAASLLLLPLMTRFLTPSEYSVMLLIANGGVFISLLFGLVAGLPTLFTSVASDAERRAACTTTTMLSVAVILALLNGAVAMFAQPISIYFLHTPAYANVISLGALFSFLNVCWLGLVAILRLTERHKLYLAVQAPVLILQTGLIVWFIAFAGMGLTGYYVAVATGAFLSSAIYAVALRRWLSGSFEWPLLGRGIRIALEIAPWTLGAMLTMNSAAFFLTRGGHLDEAGLFMVASGGAGLLLALSNSFENVWTPFVLARKDEAGLAQIQVRIFSLYSSVMLAAAAALSLFAQEIFRILTGPAFQQGYRFMPALCISYCIFCFANAFAQGLQARSRTVHYAWIGLVASAVFLVICLPLVGRFGAWAIIAAMAGGFLTMLVLMQWTSGRLLPVGYPWLRHGLMWLAAVAIIAAVYPLGLGVMPFAVKCAAFAGILGLPLLFGVLHGADLRLAKDFIFSKGRPGAERRA